MADNENTIQIKLGLETLNLKFGKFDEDVDVDDLTHIHYENLIGEVITISTLYNRIGIFKAEAEKLYDDARLSCRIFEAQKSQEIRKTAIRENRKSTDKSTEEELAILQEYRVKKQQVYKARKNFNILDALFWAIQSKDKKLSVLLSGITPKEFEEGIIEGKINHIYIKKVKRSIKGSNEK